MANNYTLFSTVIPLCKGKEIEAKEWWGNIQDPTESDDWWANPSIEFSQNEFVYVYSEESGDVERTAHLFQEYLVTFDIDDFIRFEFAYTCSKMRAGEFGGGVCIITKSEQFWCNSGSWLPDEIKFTDYKEL